MGRAEDTIPSMRAMDSRVSQSTWLNSCLSHETFRAKCDATTYNNICVRRNTIMKVIKELLQLTSGICDPIISNALEALACNSTEPSNDIECSRTKQNVFTDEINSDDPSKDLFCSNSDSKHFNKNLIMATYVFEGKRRFCSLVSLDSNNFGCCRRM